MTLAETDMKPNPYKPIRGYITKCPSCEKAGALFVHLLQKVSERGKRFATCVECDFEGELFSHKVRRVRLWGPKL
jgi:DNA-directed RNA polymerase subunit M/transcription elongation factor TFIIS